MRPAVKTVIAIGALCASLTTMLVFSGYWRATAAAASDEQTTEKDQVELAVTVYNSNLALVRDVRELSLPTGIFQLRFEDVAASINPATVHLRALNDAAQLSVLEQDYEYDLLDPQKLLQKYVGREVTLVRKQQDAAGAKYEELKALLLADTNGPVWKIGNEIVTGLSADSYRFPELPGNLYSRPTLLWTLENKGSRKERVEASYLTGNVNWSADYVLAIARDEKTAGLDGWVTLVNNSGAAYHKAKLQLVAGEVHRAEAPRREGGPQPMVAMAPAAPRFAEEAFSEYHLYTLERPTTIQDKESKQISLLGASEFPIEKKYAVEGEQYYFRSAQPGSPIPQPVKVYYTFRNEQKSGLGIPLPAGTVRVYQTDARGEQLFAGEDHIRHTPKDENVQIYIGNAFDVVAERKQTDYRQLGKDVYEEAFEVTLRNHKDAAVLVTVKEPLSANWEVVDSNYKWTKLDAFTLGFDVPVEKDGTSVLRYRIRVRW